MKTPLKSLSTATLTLATAGAWLGAANMPDTGVTSLEEDGLLPEASDRVEFVIGVADVDDEAPEAAFAADHGLKDNWYGGVSDFAYSFDEDDLTYSIDGYYFYDLRDYLFSFQVTDDDFFSLDAGATGYRSYDYGAGGYFPPEDWWFPLDEPLLSLDWETYWFDLQISPEDWPTISLRYERREKEGYRASTIWGDTFSGIVARGPRRGILPTRVFVDEARDIFEIEVRGDVDETEYGVLARYETSSVDNERQMERGTPEERSQRFVTHGEEVDTDLFSFRGFVERPLADNMRFTAGASFTTLDTDISGDRIYGSTFDALYDPTFGRRLRGDTGFTDLYGGAKLKESVLNLNLLATPTNDWRLLSSLRLEKLSNDAESHYISTGVMGEDPFEVPTDAVSEEDLDEVQWSLEARYSGIDNVKLYVDGLVGWVRGDQLEDWMEEAPTDPDETNILLDRETAIDNRVWKVETGAHWYPSSGLRMSLQAYLKRRDNDYEHERFDANRSSTNLYPGYILEQTTETADISGSVRWRILPSLRSVSRVDYQQSDIETLPDGFPRIESSESEAWIFSQTFSWTPMQRLFVQATGSYVQDETETKAADLDERFYGNLVPVVASDYWNGTASAYVIITDQLDVELQYLYYESDNYVDNSAESQPYGTDVREHQARVNAIFRASENSRLMVGYGYIDNENDATGGNADYSAHLITGRYQLRF